MSATTFNIIPTFMQSFSLRLIELFDHFVPYFDENRKSLEGQLNNYNNIMADFEYLSESIEKFVRINSHPLLKSFELKRIEEEMRPIVIQYDDYKKPFKKHFYYIFLQNLDIYLDALTIYSLSEITINNIITSTERYDLTGEVDRSYAVKRIKDLLKKTKSARFKCEGFCNLIIHIALTSGKKHSSNATISGIEFERQCARRLETYGYTCTMTPETGDFGVDILAYKDDLVVAVQCKYSSNAVGGKAVQECVAGRAHYRADFGAVLSNAPFTKGAMELAESNRISLIGENNIHLLLETCVSTNSI